ncbi:MAG: hypothetical protein ACLGI2_04020 [Acidimicrobiia bacterium]
MQRGFAVGTAFGIILVLVCDLAVLGVHFLDANTSLVAGRPGEGAPAEPTVVPRPGQAFVRGTVERLSADGAQVRLNVPFTLTPVERGAGRAVIENAMVNGQRVTISWDGGTPLPISGEGGLDLGATHVEVDASGPAYSVDGAARQFLAGTYSLGTAVAVGTGGLATPREGVRFTADSRTVLVSQGNVVVKLAPQRLQLSGPGKLGMSGDLEVQYPERTREAKSVNFGEGPFEVTVEPASRGLRVEAVLQGDVQTR